MKVLDTSLLTPEFIAAQSEDERSWAYNGLDCCVTLEIFEALLPQLDAVTTPTYAQSLALQAPIMEMSLRGILVHQGKRHELLTKYRKDIARLESQLNELIQDGIGVNLNWRSPAQLSKLFYEVLDIKPIRKRNANGKMVPTTNRDALEKLQNYFYAQPICLHLLALRDLDKKRQFLETGIDPDGRMRSSFNIAGTNTGRLSSSMSEFGEGTNLQNVDRDLRSIFVADPGMKFCNIDLEQADSRNLGALCWTVLVDEHGEDFAGAYLDACASGDLHTFVCKMCNPHLPWGTDTDRKIADTVFYRNKTYRDGAKVLGHGSNYLGTPPTMAKHSKFMVNDVRNFQTNYFNAFPCIPAYHNYVRAQLKHFKYLTTLFGRRRFFFGRHNDDATVREAVAYGPQSMTADEINIGMLNIWRSGKVQLLIQVHDSLLFQYPEELEDEIVPEMARLILAPLVLKRGREFVVPAEAKVGWNWGEQSEGNPDGLIKYKGGDTRKRQEKNAKLSLKLD